jgi:hypothetical protein
LPCHSQPVLGTQDLASTRELKDKETRIGIRLCYIAQEAIKHMANLKELLYRPTQLAIEHMVNLKELNQLVVKQMGNNLKELLYYPNQLAIEHMCSSERIANATPNSTN